MNRTFGKYGFLHCVVGLGVILLCGSIVLAQTTGAASQTQTAGQRTDGQIEMDVVHALDASMALKNDLITAATIQSEVTLSGTVSTEASKQLAESIAAHVDGVTKVHNNLTVGDPAQAAQTAQADASSSQELPDADQSQAQQNTATLPPPGPSPEEAQSQQQTATQSSAQQQASQQPQSYPQQPPARPQYQRPQLQAPQYPQQQYPQQQYPAAPPQYAQAPAYQQPYGPVTIAPGTLLQLRTSEPVDSKRAKAGEPVQFVVIQDVVAGGVLAIPRGAVVHGVVTQAQNAGSGKLAGNSVLALNLTSLDLGGATYALTTDEFRVKGPNKAGQTAGNALAGGLIGTMIGCAIGRGAGCAIGAGAGVAAGTATSAASPGPRVWIPAEALVTFHLNAPLTVTPVSAQEAARLAQGLYPGGPSLYRRPGYGPAYYGPSSYGYPGYGYPGYGYPPVYYRPYFIVGGAYYWR